ncbi:MAG TPA: hypothetical protein VHE81_23240 [Lacipirellulaceae bacterium]|nr:hypothetical protein [Lacipirellulaceae bacterium]
MTGVFQFRDDTTDYTGGLVLAHGLIAFIAIAVRTIAYLAGHLPPISFVGRFATRRWIIPGYDAMFVAPLAALLVALALPQLLLTTGIPAVFAVPFIFAVTIWCCIGLRPTIVEWHYTGHFRIPMGRPGARQLFVRA